MDSTVNRFLSVHEEQVAMSLESTRQTTNDENIVEFGMAMSVAEADAILADAELLVA